MAHKRVETERLIIEDILAQDLRPFEELLKDGEIAKGIGYKKPETKQELRQIYNNYMSAPYLFMVKTKDTEKLIGFIEFHKDYTRQIEESLRIDFAVIEDERNKGFMTEATKALVKYMIIDEMIPVISIGHYTENIRSQKVINKCGFKLEGTIRNCKRLSDGRIVDVVNYSMTMDDLLP